MKRYSYIIAGSIVIGLLLSLVIAFPASAQTNSDGFRGSVEFLNATISGNDVHAADVFTIRDGQKIGTTGTNTVQEYGIDYEPLITKMGKDRSVLLTAGYRRGNWGVNFQRWNVAGGEVLEGTVSSPPDTFTFTSLSSSRSSAIRGVRMWDQTLTPVTNMAEESQLSPVRYHASNELRVGKTDVLGERIWNNRGFQVALLGGISRGRIQNSRAEGQTQHALLLDLKLAENFTINLLDNRITLDGQTEADTKLWGPTFGASGQMDVWRLKLDWSATQSVMIGEANLVGSWTDVDDIHQIMTFDQQRNDQFILLDGATELAMKNKVVVPVSELAAKASYSITSRISAGAGIFVSSWTGVPQAPSWSVPGQWTIGAGTNWKENETHITIHGFSIFGQIRF